MKCAGREGLKNCFLKNFSLTSQQIKIYTKLIAKISEIFVYLFFHFNHGDHVFLLHELKVLFSDGIHQMSQHLGKRQRQGNSFSDSYGEFTHETKIKIMWHSEKNKNVYFCQLQQNQYSFFHYQKF